MVSGSREIVTIEQPEKPHRITEIAIRPRVCSWRLLASFETLKA